MLDRKKGLTECVCVCVSTYYYIAKHNNDMVEKKNVLGQTRKHMHTTRGAHQRRPNNNNKHWVAVGVNSHLT